MTEDREHNEATVGSVPLIYVSSALNKRDVSFRTECDC